jgi:ABC-type transporter Mla subunit MlaD
MERGKRINNLTLGAFIFAGILLFFIFIYFAGKFSFLLGGGYSLSIQYNFLDDLQPGAKLRVAGGPAIGYVNDISFEKGNIVVKVLIDGRYKINRGASFYIYSTSLVGQKYINVSGYDPTASEFFTNNEYIIGISPFGFSRTFEIAGSAINNLLSTNNSDVANKLKQTFQNTMDLVAGLNRIVKENESDLRESIHDLSYGLKNFTDIMGRVDQTMANLESFTKKLNSSMNSLTPNQIGELVSNVTTLSFELRNLSVDIEKLSYDKSSPLSLIRDKETRERFDITLKNLEIFSQKISSNPSSLIFGSK